MSIQCIDFWIQEKKQENNTSSFSLYGNFQIAWYFVECKQNPTVNLHFCFYFGKVSGALLYQSNRIPHWENVTYLVSMG